MPLTQTEIQALNETQFATEKARSDNLIINRKMRDPVPLGYQEIWEDETEVFILEDAENGYFITEDAYRGGAPSMVGNLRQRISASDNSEIQIRWNPPERFEATEVSDDGTNYIAPTNVNFHNFTGLTAATTYTFYARHKRRTAGAAVDIEAYTAPNLQAGLAEDSKTSTSITISWTEDSANDVSYEVRIDNESWIEVARGTNTYQFTGLSANTNHDIRLRGVYNGLRGGTTQISSTTSA